MARSNQGTDLDAVIVGAGFAGLYMLHKLRGMGLTARVFDAAGGVGGTWYWNRYPGARCDVVSMEYSYQFSEALQQQWEWTERYASQPEILSYLNHVADRFELRPDIQLNTRIAAAIFDERSARWTVETESADRITTRYCIMATGCLSRPLLPRIPGMDRFKGDSFHTGSWPHQPVDFTGQRVGMVGTGSSGIQCIPLIAQQAEHLYVFQRTAGYTVPGRNGPLDPEEQRRIKADYKGYRQRWSQNPGGADFRVNMTSALAVSAAERRREYEARWQDGGLPFLGAFADLLFDAGANETAAGFFRAKVSEIVRDPATAGKLQPRQVFGCKRLCVDTDYYATFNRLNLTLVDLNEALIEEVTVGGLRTRGREYALDSIVYATGFDAMTGALLAVDIRGRNGLPLREKWAAGPLTYLGLTTAGFPNLFMITGPGSPSVLSNMVVSIEQHVELIAELIAHAAGRGAGIIEAEEPAERAWVAHVNDVAAATLFRNCNSWYLGANVPGKPRVFMPYFGLPQYVEKCRAMAAAGYAGFQVR
jgi:cyclohexanone monooxygenase